jgi:inorganic pyrophosphatase
MLDKTLPEGMVFPFDFGFVPGTKGEDGDPVDVAVLADAPLFPGCVAECRLIGMLPAQQQEGKQRIRNDRYFAVAVTSRRYGEVEDCRSLPDAVLEQYVQFFADYNRLEGRKFSPEAIRGPRFAVKAMRRSLSREEF